MFVLFAMSLAILMVGIDATSVNIALVSIQRETGAHLLVLAGFMVTGGRMGDTFGRKRIFYIGVIIFGFSPLNWMDYCQSCIAGHRCCIALAGNDGDCLQRYGT